MTRLDRAATTKATTRTQRTSTQKVQNPGQVLLAIVKLVGKDVGAASERRTLAGRRRHHPVRSDDVKGKTNPEGRITEIICHLHRRFHRKKREITLLVGTVETRVPRAGLPGPTTLFRRFR